MSAALSVDDPAQHATAGKEAAVVYAAFIIFGLGSWISINSVFVQSSFLVYSQPEGWSLTTWTPSFKKRADRSHGTTGAVIDLCFTPLMAPFEKHPASICFTKVGGLWLPCNWPTLVHCCCCDRWCVGHRPTGEPALFCCCWACVQVLFLPPELAIVQPGSLAWNSGAIARSSTGAFAFSAVLGAVALLGLLFLDRHPYAKLCHEPPQACEESMSFRATSNCGTSDWRHFYPSFVAVFVGAALNFGLLPSLNPLACSHYGNSQTVLLRLNALTLLFTCAALLVTGLAKWPSLAWSPWVIPMANVVFAASFGYARTMAFFILKDGADPTHLYWLAGVVLQAGSFLGSVVSLLLVEVLKVF
eukprot:g27067.t1